MIIIYPIWSSLIFSYLDESVDFSRLPGREGVEECSPEPWASQDSYLCPGEEAQPAARRNKSHDSSGVCLILLNCDL